MPMSDLAEIITRNREEAPSLGLIDGEQKWIIGSALLLDVENHEKPRMATLSVDATTAKIAITKTTDIRTNPNNLKTGVPELTLVDGKTYWAIPITHKEQSLPKTVNRASRKK